MTKKEGFTDDQKRKIIENLTDYPPREAARQAKTLLGLPRVPHHTSVSRVIQAWRSRGSIKRKDRVCKPYKVSTPVRKNIHQISKNRNEKLSIRKLKTKLSLSHGSTQKLMRKELGKPYKVRRAQNIGGRAGKERRFQFARCLLADNRAWIRKIQQNFWFVDECDIKLQPPFNPQNDRVYAHSMPKDGSNIFERRRAKKISVFIESFEKIEIFHCIKFSNFTKKLSPLVVGDLFMNSMRGH